MPHQHELGLATRYCPDARRVVDAGRHDATAVRAERCRGDRVAMAPELVLRLKPAVADPPEPCDSVATGCEQMTPVAAECELRQPRVDVGRVQDAPGAD